MAEDKTCDECGVVLKNLETIYCSKCEMSKREYQSTTYFSRVLNRKRR